MDLSVLRRIKTSILQLYYNILRTLSLSKSKERLLPPKLLRDNSKKNKIMTRETITEPIILQ